MKLTVFTPTYNRAYIIENLYRSLQGQTCFDFEWLVVDDGSADGTEALFGRICAEDNPFPVRYFRKENGGKHSAINYGLDRAEGELFMVIDSDDQLVAEAVEKVISWDAELPRDGGFCCVAGNLGTSEAETPNRIFEDRFFDGTALDRYVDVTGEKAMAFYTEIHKKYKYPLFDGERFMTEAVTWNRMAADGYKIRFFNDIICVYEYREDGLTMAGNRLFLDNPKGYGLWMREKAGFEGAGVKEKLKMYYTFTCDLEDRLPSRDIAECIGAPVILIGAIKLLRKLLKLIKR